MQNGLELVVEHLPLRKSNFMAGDHRFDSASQDYVCRTG